MPIRTIKELHSIMVCAWTTIRDVQTSKLTEKQFHLAGRHENRFWEDSIAQTERTVGRLRQNKIARASSKGDSLCPEKNKGQICSRCRDRTASYQNRWNRWFNMVLGKSRIAHESKHLSLNQTLQRLTETGSGRILILILKSTGEISSWTARQPLSYSVVLWRSRTTMDCSCRF